jgi:polar amino acid transport system ATP-binding protein
VLAGFGLAVARGEIVALMAPSGAGKTTILRAIAGLTPFEAGEVVVGGVELPVGRLPSGLTLRALRRQVGMVFQQHFLFEHLTALENVTLAPVHVLWTRREEAEERAMRLLSSLDPARRGELGETLSALRAQGRTLLVTTHDIAFASGYATRVAVLAAGAVVEEGDPAEVLACPAHPATRQLLASGERGGDGRAGPGANLPAEKG